MQVDKHNLQHVQRKNVWSLGDCSNLPTSKTGAAIRKQAPTLVQNLLDVIAGRAPSARYDGYTSCPLMTGYGRLVLAEFDYDKNPRETFPFDQSKERWSMYQLERHLLPQLYWHGMLRGRARAAARGRGSGRLDGSGGTGRLEWPAGGPGGLEPRCRGPRRLTAGATRRGFGRSFLPPGSGLQARDRSARNAGCSQRSDTRRFLASARTQDRGVALRRWSGPRLRSLRSPPCPPCSCP